MQMNWHIAAALSALVLSSSAMAAPLPALQPVQIRGLFGESDEEKAARLKAEQHERDQDAAIADLRQRISDLEQALRQSTGQSEQLLMQVRVLTDRLDRQQKDFDYKLCTISSQLLTSGTDPNAIPCNGGPASTPQSSGYPAAPTSGNAPASGGSLGTLPANQDTTGPAAPGGDSARGEYDEAMNLLARARYGEARAAFRGFADNNPKDPLAPQAVYWVGNIAYVQKDYQNAASAFAEQIKKYPSSPQGAESMLKLGLSLIAMGEKKEGCLTLGAIKGKFKQAPPNILTQAGDARDRYCSK